MKIDSWLLVAVLGCSTAFAEEQKIESAPQAYQLAVRTLVRLETSHVEGDAELVWTQAVTFLARMNNSVGDDYLAKLASFKKDGAIGEK